MNSNPSKPAVEPPSHLSDLSKSLFIWIRTEFPDMEPHHVHMTVGLCENRDRAEQARQAILRDGAFTKNRFGELVKHPAIGVERDAWTTFSRLLRELDLDFEGTPEAKRPPMLRSIRGGAGAR